MHAMPSPPNAASFQRSGSTLNSCQRCPSVEPVPLEVHGLPTTDISSYCGVTLLLSGTMVKGPGLTAFERRMKYSTCEPGVSRPSGMIFVYSLVVLVPSQPVRDEGTVVSQAGTVPSQTTLFDDSELVGALDVSTTKHRN